MPVLWMKAAENWLAVSLDNIDAGRLGESDAGAGSVSPDMRSYLVRVGSGPDAVWVLLTTRSSRARRNGRSLPLGISVLRDRDEIRSPESGAEGALFFSTESLATVREFIPCGRPIPCARCTAFLEEGCASVRCPKCGAYHHQTDELPCWTYDGKCARCDQPTDLQSGYVWTPEGSEHE